MECDYFVRSLYIIYKPRSVNKWQQRHNTQAKEVLKRHSKLDYENEFKLNHTHILNRVLCASTRSVWMNALLQASLPVSGMNNALSRLFQ